MIDLFAPRPRTGSVASRIDATGDCWEWTGSRSMGYGNVVISGASYRAHRVVWEALVGPIPEGLTLDHLCRNQGCVNPDHLEPVTHRENVRRGYNPAALQARQTHCMRGHLLAGNNLDPHSLPRRQCVQCRNLRARLSYHRRKAWEREWGEDVKWHE